MGNQKVMMRENKALVRFPGNPADFREWADHFIDHMSMVHTAWRNALNWLSLSNEDLSFERLNNAPFGPLKEPATELAVKLEQTIVN